MTQCDDCGEPTKHRTRCKKCGMLVCRWCYHHEHMARPVHCTPKPTASKPPASPADFDEGGPMGEPYYQE